MLFVPNEAAGTRLQATGSSRVSGVRRPSASNYLTWAGDSVKDEPIADEDANKLIKDAMDDTSLNSSSMLGETIFTAMQRWFARKLAKCNDHVFEPCHRQGYGCYYTASAFQS